MRKIISGYGVLIHKGNERTKPKTTVIKLTNSKVFFKQKPKHKLKDFIKGRKLIICIE